MLPVLKAEVFPPHMVRISWGEHAIMLHHFGFTDTAIPLLAKVSAAAIASACLLDQDRTYAKSHNLVPRLAVVIEECVLNPLAERLEAI